MAGPLGQWLWRPSLWISLKQIDRFLIGKDVTGYREKAGEWG